MIYYQYIWAQIGINWKLILQSNDNINILSRYGDYWVRNVNGHILIGIPVYNCTTRWVNDDKIKHSMRYQQKPVLVTLFSIDFFFGLYWLFIERSTQIYIWNSDVKIWLFFFLFSVSVNKFQKYFFYQKIAFQQNLRIGKLNRIFFRQNFTLKWLIRILKEFFFLS